MRAGMRAFLFCALLAVVASFATAGSGETGFQFLRLGNGARAMGMGEAQAALAEGTSAIYWNPAGLGSEKSNEVSLTYLSYVEDTTYQYAAFSHPLKGSKAGVLGFAFSRFAIEDIESYDGGNGALGSVEQEDKSFQVAYGFKLAGKDSTLSREGLFAGVGLAWVSEDLAGVSADTFAGDLGLLYRPGAQAVDRWGEWMRRTSFSLSSVRMGPSAKFDNEDTDLPQETRLGVGYTHFIKGDALNFAADVFQPKGDSVNASVGVEMWVKNTLALRTGFKSGQDAGSGVRLGAGFRFKTIQFDYAWAGFGDELGDAHRISVLFRFGPHAYMTEGLKGELTDYYLSEAQDALSAGAYHEAVLKANQVLRIDPTHPKALQILFEAGNNFKTRPEAPSPSEQAEQPKTEQPKVEDPSPTNTPVPTPVPQSSPVEFESPKTDGLQ